VTFLTVYKLIENSIFHFEMNDNKLEKKLTFDFFLAK